VHDPYAWRCHPQVNGAARDASAWAQGVCVTELASCTDNPLVGQGALVVSGGNFHGAPLGLAMDTLRLAIAQMASLSRQRTAQLARRLDDLASDPSSRSTATSASSTGGPLAGGHQGLVMVLTTATASLLALSSLVPATTQWLPVDSVEDHVPNATLAALHALEAVDHARAVLAAEAVAAAIVLNHDGAAPSSLAGQWLSKLVASLPGDIRLDQPLSAILEALAARLATDPLPQLACA
jgi:histidine ammonia-lyase